MRAEVGTFIGVDGFDIAVFCVAYPAFELEFAGLAMNKPAEVDALNATSD